MRDDMSKKQAPHQNQRIEKQNDWSKLQELTLDIEQLEERIAPAYFSFFPRNGFDLQVNKLE
jgi:hypothetical protein